VPVLDAPKPPPRRLTLTLPSLGSSRWLVVFASGGEKARAVRSALADPGSPPPVAQVVRAAGAVTLLLDAGAASDLGPPTRP
jgi:6-phosphogluconolactonase